MRAGGGEGGSPEVGERRATGETRGRLGRWQLEKREKWRYDVSALLGGAPEVAVASGRGGAVLTTTASCSGKGMDEDKQAMGGRVRNEKRERVAGQRTRREHRGRR